MDIHWWLLSQCSSRYDRQDFEPLLRLFTNPTSLSTSHKDKAVPTFLVLEGQCYSWLDSLRSSSGM